MFCKHCGYVLSKDSRFCVSCGTPVAEEPKATAVPSSIPPRNLYQPKVSYNSYLETFSDRVKTNAIFWLVISILQLLLYALLSQTNDYGIGFLVIGIINFFAAISDFSYSKKVLKKPKGIIKRVKPIIVPIFTLLYNLFIGGIVGVAGSIYFIAGVRGYVMNNLDAFEEIEREQNAAIR